MSELTKLSGKAAGLRTRLLATACGAALLAAACASGPVMASDDDHPTVWIELGSGFSQLQDSQDAYLPPFISGSSPRPFVNVPPAALEKNTPYSWDGDAKISFEPEGTDWVFAAAIRYGRNIVNRSLTQLTTHPAPYPRYVATGYYAYETVAAKNIESYMVLDFSTGMDVGLGMFGSGGKSVINLGVRYAQFDSRSSAAIQYQPTNEFYTFHRFSGTFAGTRKFVGVGPSLSWDASADLIGNPQAGNISFDWGVNGAVLFGRQRMSGHHQEKEDAAAIVVGSGRRIHSVYQHSAPLTRSRQVTVPNIGGFAGMSWRLPNAKVSVGYRADMFFGAMDGGIDVAHRESRGFYGPFASISVGLGG